MESLVQFFPLLIVVALGYVLFRLFRRPLTPAKSSPPSSADLTP
jgi:hypothetical protein